MGRFSFSIAATAARQMDQRKARPVCQCPGLGGVRVCVPDLARVRLGRHPGQGSHLQARGRIHLQTRPGGQQRAAPCCCRMGIPVIRCLPSWASLCSESHRCRPRLKPGPSRNAEGPPEPFPHSCISSSSSSASVWLTPLPSCLSLKRSSDWMGSGQLIQDHLRVLRPMTFIASANSRWLWDVSSSRVLGIRPRISLDGHYCVYHKA